MHHRAALSVQKRRAISKNLLPLSSLRWIYSPRHLRPDGHNVCLGVSETFAYSSLIPPVKSLYVIIDVDWLQSESEGQLEIRQFPGDRSVRRYNGVRLHVPSQYLPDLQLNWKSDPREVGYRDTLVPLHVFPDRRGFRNRRLRDLHVVCSGRSHGELLLGRRSDEFR